MRHVVHILAYAAILALFGREVSAHPPVKGKAEQLAEECRRLLVENRPEEVLRRTIANRAARGSDPYLCEVASDAAMALSRPDEALAFALEALQLAGVGEDERELAQRMEQRIRSADPLERRGLEFLDALAQERFDLARRCVQCRLYANAVDLFTSCRGTVVGEKAQDELDKLYSKRAILEQILKSGVEVPLARDSGLPEPPPYTGAPSREYSDAFRVKTNNYTVITNISREIAEAIARLMEQMNRHYRQVYQHKLTGGGTARCEIRVYATRAEFDRIEGKHPETVRGFYSPQKNLVVTYDPRSDGWPFDGMWSTLFHEASHQFTGMTSTGVIPGWLNEGTASYFEGARLLPNGRVEANRVPESRLRGLMAAIDAGRPSLRDVISYHEPGSYDGSYYPVGWGLVYFFHNYENEDSERIYLPLYRKYMKTYKRGGNHDTFERFETYFIKKARQPEVKTFADFERRFVEWIRDLHTMEYGGHLQATALLERARVQRENGKLKMAAETYGRALHNDAECVEAMVERASVFSRLKNKDGAIYDYRRAYSLACEGNGSSGQVDPSCTPSGILAELTRLNRTLATAIAALIDRSIEEAEIVATEYRDAEYPKFATAMLDVVGRLR